MSDNLIHILLIEDNPGDQRLFTEMLAEVRNQNFDVKIFEKLIPCLETIDPHDFDVVVLDLNLPDSSGLKTFNKVNYSFPDTPIIVLSGMKDQVLALDAVRAGAQDYLNKNELKPDFLARTLLHGIERFHQKRALKNKSNFDELTGINNFRGFFALANEKISSTKPNQLGHLFFFMDVDGLKGINDTFGHLAGNQALKIVANVIRSSFRESDIYGRIGGDEFAALAVNSQEDTKRVIMNRLHQHLNTHNQKNTQPFDVQFSVGAVYWTPDMPKDLESLLKESDQAMYVQKQEKKENSKKEKTAPSYPIPEPSLNANLDSDTSAPPNRFLLVEDNPGDARLVKEYLRTSSLAPEIIHESSLTAALSQLQKQSFQLTLLDLSLPDSFGIDTVKQLLEVCPLTPVIIMTGTDDEELAKEAIQGGAQDYLVKGQFDEALLERAINYAIDRNQLKIQNENFFQSLQESEERLKSLFTHVEIGMYRTQPDGEIVFANPALIEMLGFENLEQLIKRNLELSGFPRENSRQAFKQLIEQNGQVKGLESVWVGKDGRQVNVRESAKAIKDESGDVLFYEGTAEDITDQVVANKQLRLHSAALDAAANAVMITDQNGKITYANPAFKDLTGYSFEEIVGKNPRFLKSGFQDEAFYEQLWDTIMQGMPWQGELINKRKDGRIYHEEMTVAPLNDDDKISHFIAIKNNISNRVEDAKTIQRRLEESTALEAAAVAGIESNSEDELIDRITHIIGEIINAEVYGVLLFSQGGTTPYPHPTFVGLQEEQFNSLSAFKEGNLKDVIENKKVKCVSEDTPQSGFVCNQLNIRSGVYAPLLFNHSLIGVLCVESTKKDDHCLDEKRFLRTIAGQLATGIEKIRKQESEKQQRLVAETLGEMAMTLNSSLNNDAVLDKVLDFIGELVAYESAEIYVKEEDHLRAYRHRGYDKRGLKNWINEMIIPYQRFSQLIDTGEPLVIPDVTDNDWWIEFPEVNWVRSYIAVPIINNGDFIGVISLGHSKKNYYTDEHVDRLSLFADHAAIALKNAQFLKITKQQVNRLAALRKVDEAITASLDLELTLKILLHQVNNELGVDGSSVVLYNPDLMELTRNASVGIETDQLKHMQLMESPAGQVVLNREMMMIPSVINQDINLGDIKLLSGEQVTAYIAVPLEAKGQLVGVLEVYHGTRLKPQKDWLNFLWILAGQAAIAVDNACLFDELFRSNQELTMAYDTTLEGWARALEMRDRETEGHARRVTDMTVKLAAAMRLEENQLIHIRRGSLLHDIGKMGIPDNILHKPGPLNEEEWDLMRKHPVYAYQFLNTINYLRPALDIPHYHHEKWNGSGYPLGLKGEEIPLAARLFAIVDVWDALLSDRPYRKAWPVEKVLDHIQEQSGEHFDPEVVKVFMNIVKSE